jgi:hypothetical protein
MDFEIRKYFMNLIYYDKAQKQQVNKLENHKLGFGWPTWQVDSSTISVDQVKREGQTSTGPHKSSSGPRRSDWRDWAKWSSCSRSQHSVSPAIAWLRIGRALVPGLLASRTERIRWNREHASMSMAYRNTCIRRCLKDWDPARVRFKLTEGQKGSSKDGDSKARHR